MNRKGKIILLTTCVCITLAALLESCTMPGNQKEINTSELSTAPASYVGSSNCQSCHTKEFSDWKKSDHYLAMQHAHDSAVLGDFNNTTLVADGVTNKFFKRDGKFYINTQGEDGKNHDFEVLYAFGYFPLQQYLIAFPGGRLQTTRVTWNSRDKKWFHQYAGQKIYHKDWLHWTGTSQNWNTMCASCHSTNLQKNYDFKTDTYKTTWDEINVSCESCHGPGSKHNELMSSPEYKKGERTKNSGLLYAKNPNPQLQLNTCAPCHARKSDIAQMFTPSGEIMDNLIPQAYRATYL